MSDPVFRQYCFKLREKYPCKVTANIFWSCGVDLDMLWSLDPHLYQENMKGRNVLGWLIKIVHTEQSGGQEEEPDFTWVCNVMTDGFFPESLKQGLRDICSNLDVTLVGHRPPKESCGEDTLIIVGNNDHEH